MSHRPRPLWILSLVVGLLVVNITSARAATTVITNVIPNAAQTSVSIYGQNFCTSPAPQIFMFVPPNVAAAQVLPVTSFTPSLITATLPGGASAGAYLFFVNCSGVFTGYVAVLDPEPPGATWPTGSTGATGPTGATGAPGSGANVSVLAPLASSGGPTPILSLPSVRIDQGPPYDIAIGYQSLLANTTGYDN